MWSVGCIFAELMLKEPLFQAKAEIELISMIFKLLGPPTNDSWPEFSSLPLAKSITLPSPQSHQFRQKFPFLTVAGIDLLSSLLTYDPERRISADEALQHPYFSYVPAAHIQCSLMRAYCSETPTPKHPDMFSSFPSAAAGERCIVSSPCITLLRPFFGSRRRKPFSTPPAPVRAAGNKLLADLE
jgi:cell division cycle 2-like protein